MYRSWFTSAAALMLVSVAGCAAGEKPAQPTAPVHYAGLDGECPTLTSPESQRFTGSEPARHLPAPGDGVSFEFINCAWGHAPVRPWATVVITIYRDEPGRDGHARANRRHYDAYRDGALEQAKKDPAGGHLAAERTTPSGRALLTADADRDVFIQSTVVGNVLMTVNLFDTESSTLNVGIRADELLKGLAAPAEAITAEIAGQFRPGPDPARPSSAAVLPA